MHNTNIICRFAFIFAALATVHLESATFMWHNEELHHYAENDESGKPKEPPTKDLFPVINSEDNTIRLNGQTLAFGTDGDKTISFNINDEGSEPGTVLISGNHTTTLSGNNTHRGFTRVNEGTLVITDDSNLGATGHPVSFYNGTLSIQKPAEKDTDKKEEQNPADKKRDLSIARQFHIIDDARATLDIGQDNHVYLQQSIVAPKAKGITKTGPGVLVLTNTNNIGCRTVIEMGTLAGNSLTLPKEVVANGVMQFQQEFDGIYDGNISGGGAIYVMGQGKLNLSGNTTAFNGVTIIANGFLSQQKPHGGNFNLSDKGVLSASDDAHLGTPAYTLFFNNGTLLLESKDPAMTLHINRNFKINETMTANFDVAEDTTVSLNLPIVGEGCKGVVKLGKGKLIFNKQNLFDGKVVVKEGILQVNAAITLPTDVENNATLNFKQSWNESYAGAISGTGVVNISGAGILNLTGNSSAFAGKTVVEDGRVAINNSLGGHVFVNKGSLISGAGKIGGNLSVGPDAIIAPGNSIGTLVVNGNYTQEAGSTYLVQFNSEGASSLIDVSGQATLGGSVKVVSIDAAYDIRNKYTILEAEGGIIGQYADISAETTNGHAALYTPHLSYDPNNVFFTLTPNLFNATKTYNQRRVAGQLDSITDPTDSQAKILNKMIGLTHNQARHSLNQMSAQQHSSDLLIVELMNRQFIRRLYDPIRLIAGSDPCIQEWYELEKKCLCGGQGVDVWFEGSGTRLSQEGGENAIGFKSDGGEVTFGAQKTFCNNITTGAAVCYEYDDISYHVGGSGSMNSALAGVYALYRPARYYILTDVAFSYSWNRIKRPITIGSDTYHAKSTPNISQLTAYSEAGIDYLWEDLLIQPFLGIEASNYWRDRVKEHGAGDLNVVVNSRKLRAVNSRLGVHLNAFNLPTEFNLYIDLAWVHRWTDRSNCFKEHFETFGTDFVAKGVSLYRNTFEVGVAITKDVCCGWTFFADCNAEFWKGSTSYYVLGGFERSW